MECIAIVVVLGVCLSAIWNMARELTYMYMVPLALWALAMNIEGRR